MPLTIVLAAPTTGCGSAASDPPPASTGAPIVNGVPDVDTPIANAVVEIVSSASSCTGFLVTSTLALTASHCRYLPGDTLYIGTANQWRENPAPPRARRRVTAYVPFEGPPPTLPPAFGGGTAMPTGYVARDVAIVRFWPPVVSEASPQKPHFARPPLYPMGAGVSFADPSRLYGMAGYGSLRAFLETPMPVTRQQLEAFEGLMHVDTGDGFGYWLHSSDGELSWEPTHDDFAHVTGFSHGDSGGPLYWYDGRPQRLELGTASKMVRNTCWLDGVLCTPSYVSYWADLTAPSMRAWIESQVDPNGDGRWEGEVDYLRTSYASGEPPECSSVDQDCDGVYDHADVTHGISAHDSCPTDWNPDQYNADDPVDSFDPTNRGDPGDVCDLCPKAFPDGDNCNDDAEQLQYGSRATIAEGDVVGDSNIPGDSFSIPASLGYSAAYMSNLLRFRADACDPTPCTRVASKLAHLPEAIYGAPPSGPIGLEVEDPHWTANVTIEHDARVAAAPDGSPGATGYDFCKCPGPFTTQHDRLANCFSQYKTDCPKSEKNNFDSPLPPAYAITSARPAFSPIPGVAGESGTIDQFTSTKKTNAPSFDWAFENDYGTIMGTSISLPLTPATASAIALDGLVWSNVRAFPKLTGHEDLASSWAPLKLRIGRGGTPVFPKKLTSGSWFGDCPQCGIGFSKPWLWGGELLDGTVHIFAGTPSQAVDVTDATDVSARAVIAAGSQSTNAPTVVVSASEPESVLRRADQSLGVRMALFDTEQHAVVAAVAQRGEDGALTAVRDAAGQPPGERTLQAASLDRPVACPFMPWRSESTAVALSGLKGALFVASRPAGGKLAVTLSRFDVATGTWTQVALKGAPILGPVAMTYDWADDSLYVVDRAFGAWVDAVRLLRIRPDGTAQVFAAGLWAGPQSSSVTLSVDEEGNLVVATSRQLPRRYRIARLDVSRAPAVVTGRLQDKGLLAAAPMLNDRALALAVRARAESEATFVELVPTALSARGRTPFGWVFE